MQITGQIQSVIPKKSGNSVKDGRNISWTIFEVTINGQKFSTFDSAFQGMIGQSGTYEYETRQKIVNGKTYDNATLLNINRKPAAATGTQIMEKLEEILQEIKNLRIEPTVGDGDMGFGAPTVQQDDINVDDIPF